MLQSFLADRIAFTWLTSLRHTVGADLRKRGADIQDVLRHADIGATQIYTHMVREELRKKLPKRFMPHRP